MSESRTPSPARRRRHGRGNGRFAGSRRSIRRGRFVRSSPGSELSSSPQRRLGSMLSPGPCWTGLNDQETTPAAPSDPGPARALWTDPRRAVVLSGADSFPDLHRPGGRRAAARRDPTEHRRGRRRSAGGRSHPGQHATPRCGAGSVAGNASSAQGVAEEMHALTRSGHRRLLTALRASTESGSAALARCALITTS